MRFRGRLPLLFFGLAFLLLLFTIYNVISPRTYTVPLDQQESLWRTWAREWKEGKEATSIWDGAAMCKGGTSNARETLRFREDGSFRIAIFTDLHFSCGHKCEVDHNTQLLVDSILEMERPDLVVFNGDLIQSEGGSQKSSIFLDVLAPAERRGIPFAVIFGNHDSDGPYAMSRDVLVNLVSKCPHSIVMTPSEFTENKGNYIRTLQGVTTTQLLFLETNRDSMSRSQVQWLRETMDVLQFNEERKFFSTLVFMHIPPKEFVAKLCGKDTVCNGLYGERAEPGGKEINTGFYDTFQSFKGSVRAIFSGHDHKNDVCSVHPSSNSDSAVEVLCYARASGYPSPFFTLFYDKLIIRKYGGYGHDILAKGSRIIHINEKTNSLFSYVVTDNGERSQMLHFTRNDHT